MLCPKCGATQADDRADCASCGIVFARWKPREQRLVAPAPATPEKQPIPLPFIVAGAVLLILAGLVWNKHRQAVRASQPSTDEMINALNNAEVARRKEQQKKLVHGGHTDASSGTQRHDHPRHARTLRVLPRSGSRDAAEDVHAQRIRSDHVPLPRSRRANDNVTVKLNVPFS